MQFVLSYIHRNAIFDPSRFRLGCALAESTADKRAKHPIRGNPESDSTASRDVSVEEWTAIAEVKSRIVEALFH
jgi:hypothetical protein